MISITSGSHPVNSPSEFANRRTVTTDSTENSNPEK